MKEQRTILVLRENPQEELLEIMKKLANDRRLTIWLFAEGISRDKDEIPFFEDGRMRFSPKEMLEKIDNIITDGTSRCVLKTALKVRNKNLCIEVMKTYDCDGEDTGGYLSFEGSPEEGILAKVTYFEDKGYKVHLVPKNAFKHIHEPSFGKRDLTTLALAEEVEDLLDEDYTDRAVLVNVKEEKKLVTMMFVPRFVLAYAGSKV